ncbi:family 78 glycoside hydrolase catalytic domain [Bacillus sp. OTU530]|uniref:family 78 glycoside hydrolase catalytic domain n=1 Tax=Bacillus sp. OTU530 TaxID=3043862 RepID=UPI00313CB515
MLFVKGLTCEYRKNLLGTDVKIPRFSWKIESEKRGTYQQAYQIQVTGSAGNFQCPIWDTGRVESEQSIQVEYAGTKLQSRTRYHYRIKVWDNFGRESDWSEPSWWETAFLSMNEWKAQWISPNPDAIDPHSKAVFLLRKSVHLKRGIVSARIYATAAGVYEIHLNSSKVGDDLLAPGWTSYLHRHQYQTYDVTHQLQSGMNGIGIVLGDGWYKGEVSFIPRRNFYGDRRAALLQLHVQYDDGTEELIVSDSTWKSSTGPILLSEFFAGETYDARLEKEGWTEPDYDDADWNKTAALDLPMNQLVAQENWPTRVTETIRPKNIIQTPSGDTLLDMGQNMVGRIRMTLNVPAGTCIRLQHAEVLDKDGNFYTGNLRSAKQIVKYIAKGGGKETYAPHFSFQGFQYVKVEGFSEQENNHKLLLESFIGEVMHSDMEPTGDFECSHPMVNQLQSNIKWGQRGNFLDVPTDCPQRDERLGWTGDAQVFIRTAAFNYHVGPFFTKWVRDLKADQKPDGSVPYVVPDVLVDFVRRSGKKTWGDETYTSSAWGDAATICPWTLYLCYGDTRLLSEQYDSMKAWVEYIRNQGENEYLWNTGFQFGDWLALDAEEDSYYGATPEYLVANAYYALSTRILRDAAAVLGKEEDVHIYSKLLEGIVAQFHENFVTSDGRMTSNTQTAHILPLMFDLVEGEVRERVARDLNELVVQNDYHLTTGFVGTPYLCLALSSNGYHSTAVKLLLQESYPSWLYSITKGATTIWEHWDGIKQDGSFWSDAMNSFNHYAYGAIGDWMYRYVAGLDMDEKRAAYKRIRIHPHFSSGELTYARASFISLYGKIESNWSVDNNQIIVKVQIPANTTAEIILPGASLSNVMEGNLEWNMVEGIHSANEVEGGARLLAGSGSYYFTYPKHQVFEKGYANMLNSH